MLVNTTHQAPINQDNNDQFNNDDLLMDQQKA